MTISRKTQTVTWAAIFGITAALVLSKGAQAASNGSGAKNTAARTAQGTDIGKSGKAA